MQAIERSVAYLEDHYIDYITVEQLSQLAGVKLGNIARYFKGLQASIKD